MKIIILMGIKYGVLCVTIFNFKALFIKQWLSKLRVTTTCM